MSLTKKAQNKFASFRGTPASDTDWDNLDFGQNFKNMKIIVTGAPLEFSLDGKELYGSLPIGTHDFLSIYISKFFVRKTGATIELYAFGTH